MANNQPSLIFIDYYQYEIGFIACSSGKTFNENKSKSWQEGWKACEINPPKFSFSKMEK